MGRPSDPRIGREVRAGRHDNVPGDLLAQELRVPLLDVLADEHAKVRGEDRVRGNVVQADHETVLVNLH